MAYIRSNTVCVYIGLARIIYIRCINDFNCREITKYTVKYGVYVRFWRTLCGRPRAKPPGSFRLLTLQKKSFPTQLSAPKTVEWLGRYAQFRGIGLFARGGGGVHGVDHVCTVHGNLMYGLGQPYIYALQLHCVSSLDAHGHTLWVAS
jgi:hypothetical protein